MTLGCELIWDEQDAGRVRKLIEEATGRECPCLTGLSCPLLPATLTVLPVPRPRVA